MSQVLLVVLGSFLTGFVWLVQRQIKKEPLTEAITRISATLDVRQRMQEQGVTLAELEKFQAEIMRQRRDNEDRITLELKANAPLPEERIITQAEMNTNAAERFREAEDKMQFILGELQQYLARGERFRFFEVQAAWEKYREEQSEYASSIAEGGSMQPMLRSSERERLTIERAAALQTELDFRRATAEPISG
jgi:uncharacterized protein YecT (DUF1311 family)